MNAYERHEIRQMFRDGELSYWSAIELLEEDCGYNFKVAEDIVSNWVDWNNIDKMNF